MRRLSNTIRESAGYFKMAAVYRLITNDSIGTNAGRFSDSDYRWPAASQRLTDTAEPFRSPAVGRSRTALLTKTGRSARRDGPQRQLPAPLLPEIDHALLLWFPAPGSFTVTRPVAV